MKSRNKLFQTAPSGPYSPWSSENKPPVPPDRYMIEVVGCLSGNWSDWFNGLTIQCDEDRGISTLHGQVKDQAELYSILLKIRNLGLTLMRVNGDYGHP